MENTCPYCGQIHRSTARFCPMSGQLIPPAKFTPKPNGTTGQLPPRHCLNNRYTIIKRIGKGGMAAVYQVEDIHSPGVYWAVKEMSDSAIPDESEKMAAIKRFRDEAIFLQTLYHPNLPKVIDSFTEGGKHYLVMEFVPGLSLESQLEVRGRPYDEDEIVPWAVQLCNVLSYLHSQPRPIIFRDLKPSNIMLTPQGNIKLIDFGIARTFKHGKAKDTRALGTPGYSAPEATSGQTDARSDIYSLCVTLHQLLTDHDPASTIFNLPPVRQINPAVSPEMQKILIRGTQNDREMRWNNMIDLGTELKRLQQLRASPPELEPTHRVTNFGPVRTHVAPNLMGEQIKTSRPTTRLLEVTTQIPGHYLAIIFVIALLLLVGFTWLLAPTLEDTNIEWNNVPIIAIFGALGYAAFPKRGVTFVSQAVVSFILVSTIWTRLGSQGFSWVNLVIASIVSGLFMEFWVFLLPKIKGNRRPESWRIEVSWLAGMALIGTFLFLGLASDWVISFNLIQIIMCAILGITGWFLGDFFRQYVLYRKTITTG